MNNFRYWILPALVVSASLSGSAVQAQPALVNSITLPGNATDLIPGSDPNLNRLGGLFSDVYYDRQRDVYYGLPDRGMGGGTIAYDTRVQKFTLNVDSNTGAISGFNLLETIKFTDGSGNAFNGLNPLLLNGNKSILGRSLDPEGFTIDPHGNFYVADEYGPSVYRFSPTGQLLSTFTAPSNLLPREAGGALNFVDGRPTITSGRQDNRGYEGIAITPDGKKLYAILQDPLVNEGDSSDGRRSRNLRIVEYDAVTGASTGQYIYQLESIADINGRIAGTANDFTATNQGRNIGVSAIVPISNTSFLVLERDNRGIGVDNPTGNIPVGSKRLFQIDLAGATDVSGISLAGSNALPGGVTPVSKSLFLDIQAALTGGGLTIPEKIEGVTIGRQLSDGSYNLLIGTDNDFSVTQNGSGQQFDVYTDGTQVPIGGVGPAGQTLLPSYLYSFKTPVVGYTALASAPEPGTLALIALGGLALGGVVRRRRTQG